MESFAVKFLNVDLLHLIHVGEVAGVKTFVDLRDGVIDVITKVHHFFLHTFTVHSLADYFTGIFQLYQKYLRNSTRYYQTENGIANFVEKSLNV